MISLLNEKYADFSSSLPTNIKITRNITGMDPSRPNLFLLTPEYLFEIIKTNIEELGTPSLVIIDEMHLITDKTRGFGLDISMTLLKVIFSELQFLVMSATMDFPTRRTCEGVQCFK